jgi:MFS family permease
MSARATPRPPLWTASFSLVVAATALLFVGFYAALPALPRLGRALGAATGEVGWVITTFSLAAMTTRLLVARHLDGHCRPKFILAGLALYSAGAAAHPWCAHWEVLLAVRVLHGVGWGLATTAIGAVVADLTPAARRGEGLGSWGLAPTAAMASGPLLGEAILAWRGFAAVFATTALGGVLAAAAIAPVGGGAKPAGPPVASASPAGPPVLPPGAVLPALALFLSSLSYGALVAFLPLEMAAAPGRAGGFFTAYALAVLAARPVAGRLSDLVGRRPVIVPGLLLGAAGTVLLGLAPAGGPLIGAAVLIGVGIGGASYPGLMALAVDRTPVARRGATMGAYFTAYDLAIALGAALLGPVYAAGGFAALNLVAAIGIVAAVPVVLGCRTGRF